MSDFWKDIWDSKGRSDSKDLLWLCGREHLDIPWNSKKEFENIKHLLNLKEDDKVLEVGCGAGFLSREFVDYDYRGVDYSKSLIQKHKELFPNHEVQVSESSNLPFKDKEFDILFSSGIFQYFSNEDYFMKTVEEFKRVTKRAFLALDIKKKPTNPRHYCLPQETFVEQGFKIYDATYKEMDFNYYNILMEL